MAIYQAFQSARTSEPDPVRLLGLLQAIDVTMGVLHDVGSSRFLLKRSGSASWTALEIQTAQTLIDTAPEQTTTTLAESRIDRYPPELRAMLLVLVDQTNVLRTRAGLVAVTPAQAIQAVKDKLATL